MAYRQSQGLGGITLKSTNDLSGLAADVSNGNPVGSTYKNAVGLAAMADTSNASSFVVNTTGRTVPTIGVIGDTPRAGENGKLDNVPGTIVKVLAGGAVSVGDKLVPDTSGRAVTMTTTPAYVFAQALEAATAAGQLIAAIYRELYIPTTP